MTKCVYYVDRAKNKLGGKHVSDRAVGEALDPPFSQSAVTTGKNGYMTDPLAMALAKYVGCEPGELLLVARAEREKEGPIKAALLAYAKNVLAAIPSKVPERRLSRSGWEWRRCDLRRFADDEQQSEFPPTIDQAVTALTVSRTRPQRQAALQALVQAALRELRKPQPATSRV